MSDIADKLRLDKWLWHARFFKTRTLAAKVVGEAGVRINGDRTSKAAHGVIIGDVLTFTAGERVRIVKIRALGTRRGPAPEAQALYEDMSPAPSPRESVNVPRFEGGGRPTKANRRELDKLRARGLE
ncbi:MAG: RNA-binding S4 domain-containing protein [Marinovum sp.]|nr:RNA-binding S4 domain-containing protein [Marinovum sp.]